MSNTLNKILKIAVMALLILFISLPQPYNSLETVPFDIEDEWYYDVEYTSGSTGTAYIHLNYTREYQQWLILEDVYINDEWSWSRVWFVFDDWTSDYVMYFYEHGTELHFWTDDPIPFFLGIHPSYKGESIQLQTIGHVYDAVNDRYLFNGTYRVWITVVDEAKIVYANHVIPVFVVNQTITFNTSYKTRKITNIIYVNNDFKLPFIITSYMNGEKTFVYTLTDYRLASDPIDKYPLASTTTTIPPTTTSEAPTTTAAPITDTPPTTTQQKSTLSQIIPSPPTTSPKESTKPAIGSSGATSMPTSTGQSTSQLIQTPYSTNTLTQVDQGIFSTDNLIYIIASIGGAAVIASIGYILLSHRKKPGQQYMGSTVTTTRQPPPPTSPQQLQQSSTTSTPPPQSLQQHMQQQIPQIPSGKKICPYCRAIIPAKAKFCPRCGRRLV